MYECPSLRNFAISLSVAELTVIDTHGSLMDADLPKTALAILSTWSVVNFCMDISRISAIDFYNVENNVYLQALTRVAHLTKIHVRESSFS